MDYLVHVLFLVIGCSVPLAFTTLLLSFSFWGISAKPYMRRVLLFAVLDSLVLDLIFLVVPDFMKAINAISMHFLLILLLFPRLSVKQRLISTVTALIFCIVAEGLVAAFQNQFVANEVRLESPLLLISGYWPLAGFIYLIHHLMDRHAVHPGRSVLIYVRQRKDTKIPAVLLFFSVQFLLILWIASYKALSKAEPPFIGTLLLVTLAISLITMVLVLRVFTSSRNEAVKMTQQHYIDDINRMFTTVRGQRHDFLNHVQVMSSFIRLRKYDELERYTRELVGETSEVNEIMRIGNPALAALVQAKCAIALSLRIHFEYECTGMDSPSLGLKSIDLIKIIGNLLDNAFDEVVKLPIEQRVVRLNCRAEQGTLVIAVQNDGTYIREDVRARLFEPGFSTKDGAHRGLGLSIVRELLDFYSGTIEVDSEPVAGTSFHVRVPMKKAAPFE